MRRLLPAAFWMVWTCLVVLAAVPVSAWASNLSCTAALVTAGVCRQATNSLLFYDAPSSHFADLRDAMVARYPRPATVPCTTVRTFAPLLNGQPSKLLATAGVTPDGCSLGTTVNNPISTGNWADAAVEAELRNIVIRWKNQAAVDEADDPSAVGTPDVGAP